MPFESTRKRPTLLAIESTYNTPPSMVAADAFLSFEPVVRVIADKLARPRSTDYFGADLFVLVGRRIEIEFEVDLLGASTLGVAAPHGRVYRSCGYAQVLTATTSAAYSLVSSGFESATIDFYWAGIRYRLTGARGGLSTETKINTYSKAKVKYIGNLVMPTDATPPAGIVYTAFRTPPGVETPTWSLTLGGVALHARELVYNANEKISKIDTSETSQVIYTNRAGEGNLIVVKNDPLSTWNPYTLADNQTTLTLISVVDGGSTFKTTETCKVRLGYPENTEVEEVAAWNIPLTFVPDSGNDEHALLLE